MLNIHANISNTDSPLGTSGVDFLQLSEGNDRLIFTNGSLIVADGEPIPSQSDLISAGIVLTGSEIICDKYLVEDISANELQEIFLMGNQDTQYVLAFEFTTATASEPVLEIWDDDTLSSIDSIVLGSGTANQSFFHGITTTNGSPGVDWVGSRLAGSASGNFLELNDGAGFLTAADVLYCNLKLIIPASQTSGFSLNPVIAIKYLSN